MNRFQLLAPRPGLVALTAMILAGTGAPALAQSATAESAAGESGTMQTYERRIRQAMTPDELRMACRAPRGAVIINNEIIVCSERDEPYRVPSTAESRVIDPEEDSPVAERRAVMNAEAGAPVGSAADTFRPGTAPGIDPVKFIKSIQKVLDAE